jgi:ornithine--oxo-acid transaminase
VTDTQTHCGNDPRSYDYAEIESRYGARNYRPLDVVLTRGEGVWVWDVEGRKYLDCLSAYSAINQGHCHPRIFSALTEQAMRLTLTSRAFRHNRLAPLYQLLAELTGAEQILLMNSGVEAVETAIKLARKWAYEIRGVADGKAEIVVCENNFHGRTLGVVGFSSDPKTRDGFGPFAPGFKTVSFGDAAALEAAITSNTAAFLVEPIQGEAGVIIPPAGYLREIRALCSRHNMLLILDEIQTGLGRTGKLLAQQHEGVRADVTLLGKALSGGYYPVSAVLADRSVMQVIGPGEHGSTFGGNPLACAVADAALRVVVEEGLPERAAERGAQLLGALKLDDVPYVRAVRGAGLMVAVELDPAAGGARRYCEALRESGILCKETHDNIIRIAPPLIISPLEVEWAAERFSEVLSVPPAELQARFGV